MAVERCNARRIMRKKSAGILLYRHAGSGLEVLLAHPGGPFWRNKDDGAWTIPKGEFADEDPLAAARREFAEELGVAAPFGAFLELKPIEQKNAKTVYAWAIEGDFDPAQLKSNTFLCEWPPKSQRMQEFPEVDRVEWFVPDAAKRKIRTAQSALIDQLIELLN